MICQRGAIITLILLSLFLLPSPSMAEEWVSAGTDQPGFRILDVAVSGDGAYGALAGDAGIILYTSDGKEVWRTPNGNYHRVALSGDGGVLVAGGDGIRVIHQNSTVCATIRTKNYVNDVAISADGNRLAAAVDDETLRIYNVSGHLLYTIDTGDDLMSVAVSPDGTYIAGATSAGNVVLFSDSGEERWRYGLSRQPATSVAIAEGARTIAAVSEDGAFVLLSRAGGLLGTGSAPHAAGVVLTTNGDTAAIGDADGVRFLHRDGTPAGRIADTDASVSVAMDAGGTLMAITDGTHITGFTQKNILPVQTSDIPSAGETPLTPVRPSSPETEPPVPTRSPVPLVAVAGGLVLGTVLIATGRRYTDS